MTKRNEIYKCSESKNLFEVITPSNEAVCGLERVVENTTEAATEKHIPVVEKIDGGYRVTVGSVEHPMMETHFIEWIELITDNNEVLRKYLEPTDKPIAEFKTDAKKVVEETAKEQIKKINTDKNSTKEEKDEAINKIKIF